MLMVNKDDNIVWENLNFIRCCNLYGVLIIDIRGELIMNNLFDYFGDTWHNGDWSEFRRFRWITAFIQWGT